MPANRNLARTLERLPGAHVKTPADLSPARLLTISISAARGWQSSADPFHVSGGSFQGPLRDDDGPAAVPAVATAAAVSFPDGDDDGMLGDAEHALEVIGGAAAAQEPGYY